MVNSTSTELPIEFLGPEAPEILDCEGPEVQHIVSGEGISFLQNDHFGPQKSQLDGRTQATWPPTDDQTLNTDKWTRYRWFD